MQNLLAQKRRESILLEKSYRKRFLRDSHATGNGAKELESSKIKAKISVPDYNEIDTESVENHKNKLLEEVSIGGFLASYPLRGSISFAYFT